LTGYLARAGRDYMSGAKELLMELYDCRDVYRRELKSPARQTQIRHDGLTPEPKRLYRCHVCRLELVLDEETQTLAVAPLPPDLRS
jgi:hypothetical protein